MSENKIPGFSSSESVKSYVGSVEWQSRLGREIPFLAHTLREAECRSVLDLGCGPGMHVGALAAEGFEASGADISEKMVEEAQSRFPELSFTAVDLFADLDGALNAPAGISTNYDALLSLGNTLMLVWSQHRGNELSLFRRLANLLRPGGLLIFQVLSSDNPRSGYVAGPLVSNADGDGSRTMQLKHFTPRRDDRLLLTSFATLRFAPDSDKPEVIDSRQGELTLLPLPRLKVILSEAGFGDFCFYGGYDAKSYDPGSDDSLLCVARCQG